MIPSISIKRVPIYQISDLKQHSTDNPFGRKLIEEINTHGCIELQIPNKIQSLIDGFWEQTELILSSRQKSLCASMSLLDPVTEDDEMQKTFFRTNELLELQKGIWQSYRAFHYSALDNNCKFSRNYPQLSSSLELVFPALSNNLLLPGLTLISHGLSGDGRILDNIQTCTRSLTAYYSELETANDDLQVEGIKRIPNHKDRSILTALFVDEDKPGLVLIEPNGELSRLNENH